MIICRFRYMMEKLGFGEEEVCSGYRLVPWQSWYEWNYVRESLFSSSPASISAALSRISAWRSRGCLPVAVAVTAIIIETRQRDPLFREGLADDGQSSEEMLSMAYSMAIMRLVNGFVEQSNKKTRLSIADTAEAIGLPRLLIDVRHEGSHRDLPSLPLLRLASSKALNWLKSYYWEPQKHLVPDVRKEIKLRLRKMALFVKVKQGLPLTSQLTGRCVKQSDLICGRSKFFSRQVGKLRLSKSADPKKQMTKIAGSLIRLYSASPSEVVAVLLEECFSKTSGFSDGTGIAHSDGSQVDSNPGDLRSLATTIDDWKVIIMKLSSKKPELLLMMLKVVLEKIENSGAITAENDKLSMLSLVDRADTDHIKHLSSLVSWLLKILKKLKKSNRVESTVESPEVFSSQRAAIPEATLTALLRKCLLNIARGHIHLSDSAHFLLQMITEHSSTEQLKRLLMLTTRKPEFKLGNDAHTDPLDILRQQEGTISRAKKNLEVLKRVRTENKIRLAASTGDDMGRRNPWTVAKSWSPCPIGMLPCPFTSYGILPVLERASGLVESPEFVEKDQLCEENSCGNVGYKRDASLDFVEYPGCVKKVREMDDEKLDDLSDFSKADDQSNFSPMDGLLLVGGYWKKVGVEELQAIESAVHILI